MIYLEVADVCPSGEMVIMATSPATMPTTRPIAAPYSTSRPTPPSISDAQLTGGLAFDARIQSLTQVFKEIRGYQ